MEPHLNSAQTDPAGCQAASPPRPFPLQCPGNCPLHQQRDNCPHAALLLPVPDRNSLFSSPSAGDYFCLPSAHLIPCHSLYLQDFLRAIICSLLKLCHTASMSLLTAQRLVLLGSGEGGGRPGCLWLLMPGTGCLKGWSQRKGWGFPLSIHKQIFTPGNSFILSVTEESTQPPAAVLLSGIACKGSAGRMASGFWLKLQTCSWEGEQVLGVKNNTADLLCLLLSDNTSFPGSSAHLSLAFYCILYERRLWEIHF